MCDSVCAICDDGGELLWYVVLFFDYIFIRKDFYDLIILKVPAKLAICVQLHVHIKIYADIWCVENI